MLFAILLVICVATVPLAGGRLSNLADVRFRKAWLASLALAIQVAIVYVVPHGPPKLLDAAHLFSYALAAAFVVVNRRVPGLLVIGLGGASNILAIAINGGVMPASPSALERAGLVPNPGQFASSIQLAHPKLAFLGDVFAVPSSWPVHNVFSIGDICIVLGAAFALHRISNSRLVAPRGDGPVAELRRNSGFMRLWLAQGISNLGDWMYTLAVVTSLAQRQFGAQTFALLLICQVGPAALTGLLGGPLVDRLSRKWLMIGADAARALAVMSLLFAGTPSVTHFCVVGAMLGLFGALFEPSLQASLPNLVAKRQLVAANSLVTGTYHLAVMLGPILGAVLVASLGFAPAFLLNMASFVLSAGLIAGVRIPHVRAAREAASSAVGELVEGIRYSLTTPLVRTVMAVTGLLMVAASIRAPIEPLFFLRVVSHRPEALGLAGATWGLGMMIGSFAAPALARRFAREQLLSASVAAVGLAVLAASQSPTLVPVLGLWVVAGVGNALCVVSYQSLLQERTPDALRGRVLAASEGVLDASLIGGAALAAWLGTAAGPRGAFAVSGLVFLAGAALGAKLLGRGQPVPARPVADRLEESPAQLGYAPAAT